MPVSTFSPDHSARSHGGMIARWSSTRQRIDADERLRRLSEMQELDGTGLYERADWPLPASSTAAENEDQRAKAIQQLERAELEQQSVDQAAVVRSHRDIGMPSFTPRYTTLEHEEVSDIEEEDEDEEEEEEDEDEDSTSYEEPRTPPHQQAPRLSRLDLQRGSQKPSLHRLSPQRRHGPEVSPIREHEAVAPGPMESQEGRQSRADAVPLQVNGPDLGEEEQLGDELEKEDMDESRDLATPIPLNTYSPELQQGTPQSQATGSPTPTTNGVNNRSSIAKAPVQNLLHRRSSTRNSIYNTTQIPYQKDRVRYSWQSVQDDEPNRPRIHVIKLVSNTATASAGFPTGEAFGFSISPGGRRIAAYNSARLYVLQTAALPVGISQDYALKRRPLAVELTDEGNVIAILADDHTVNIYELGHQLRRTKTLKLDFPTSNIALAPTGGLLAAAYEGGIEVFSLHNSALPTDRRAVRCVKMDRMAFSEDSSTILGTTTRINAASTVVVSVPVFGTDASGLPSHEELKEAWCSELLHPENIRNSSHATFMRENRKTTNERLFSWNGLEDTFGILNVGDMHYGTIDFPVVISPPLSTCGGLGAAIHSCPAIDEHGDTVAMIVNDRTIRLYIIPHTADEDSTSVEAHSIDHELDEGYGCPFSEVRWVYSSASLPAPSSNRNDVTGRLIVTSPGGVNENGVSEESVEDVEGGRIILFDFDPQFAGQPGQTFSLMLGKSPPLNLDEEQMDVTEQVNLVRRRTVNQRKGNALNSRPMTLGRSATTHGNRGTLRSGSPALSNIGGHRNRNSILSIGSLQSEAARSLPDLHETNEVAEEATDAFEEPYVQGAPRSQASLQRAASNAQRHRFQTLEERQQERVSVDSNGHFLPLPEYTEEPNAPLPSRFRQMAGLDTPAMFSRPKPAVVTSANGSAVAPSSSSSSNTPLTAPASIGENFSADQAFRAASSNLGAPSSEDGIRETTIDHPTEPSIMESAVSTPTSIPNSIQHGQSTLDAYSARNTPSAMSNYPAQISAYGAQAVATFNSTFAAPGRTGTFDSLASMPRSLQRAYSNAVSPIGHGAPPSIIGDWNNVISPVGASNPPSSRGDVSAMGMHDEESWDAISPIAPASGRDSPFTRPSPITNSPFRYSTPLVVNPSSHTPPRRAPSAASSPSQMPLRRLPPHMEAFRSAAAANASASASASLFPPSQPSDHIPLRQPPAKASAAAHPITAWHPPASSPRIPASGSGAYRGGHSRRRSLADRTAFASTAKAKKLGFFKKTKRVDPWGPTKGYGEEGGSVMETKSMITWISKSEKCALM